MTHTTTTWGVYVHRDFESLPTSNMYCSFRCTKPFNHPVWKHTYIRYIHIYIYIYTHTAGMCLYLPFMILYKLTVCKTAVLSSFPCILSKEHLLNHINQSMLRAYYNFLHATSFRSSPLPIWKEEHPKPHGGFDSFMLLKKYFSFRSPSSETEFMFLRCHRH
jgi:hypothetical protein